MRSLRLGLVGVVLLLMGGGFIWPAAAVSDVHVVNTGVPATPFGFSPATQSVNAGDTVQWINDTGATHTATSDDGTSFNVAISMGGGGTSSAFSGATRDIAYHCSIHSYMTGTIHVVAAATTSTAKATTTTAKAVTTTARATTTSRATTSSSTPTTETIDFNTTTSEESTTSSTAGQVAIKTKGGGGNGAAIAVLVVALAAVFGGGGYALYRMRRP